MEYKGTKKKPGRGTSALYPTHPQLHGSTHPRTNSMNAFFYVLPKEDFIKPLEQGIEVLNIAEPKYLQAQTT